MKLSKIHDECNKISNPEHCFFSGHGPQMCCLQLKILRYNTCTEYPIPYNLVMCIVKNCQHCLYGMIFQVANIFMGQGLGPFTCKLLYQVNYCIFIYLEIVKNQLVSLSFKKTYSIEKFFVSGTIQCNLLARVIFSKSSIDLFYTVNL